jgi:hypothetical protein
VTHLEALARKISTPGLTRKKRITKLNLALGPKGGQEYRKYKAYTIIFSDHLKWKSEYQYKCRNMIKDFTMRGNIRQLRIKR